ncbi:MAG: hypothetical protein EOM91_15240 [Sphingobacteriia bacterium]|nr:hypothetical protein [Sphingobacteriia bacterium]NCC40511.1 hypothetical protein [Gammaproteobacteria bacterium]
MDQESVTSDPGARPANPERTPEQYLDALDPNLRASFSEAQLDAVKRLLESSIPRPAPKLVDLRLWLDLFASRYYLVLFIGRDRRRHARSDLVEPMARKGNLLVVLLVLLGLSLLVSLTVITLALLVKYSIHLSLFPNPR